MVSDRFASMLPSPPVVLTIAGFDPSSGAGVTADIKTIAAHGCYGVAAITAMTVQSTTGVRRVEPSDTKLLRETLAAIIEDVKVSAVHIGMLGSAAVAAELASFLLEAHLPNIVLDPIISATSGAKLLDDAGRKVLKEKILPLCILTTPNAQEAAILTGLEVISIDDMKLAAARLREMGAKNAVVTGGHLDVAADLLSFTNGDMQIFKSERLELNFTHGTGCAFASAITCHLAQGRPIAEAVLLSKAYISAAIANGYTVGKGINPVNHMYRMKNHPGGYAKRSASGRD